MNTIFKRVPLMLALTCELPKPGDYKAMEIVGVPVLIARDSEGMARAFFNVCAHRWSPVANEGLGNCPRLRFTCPFHGWTYAADGRLIAIADPAKFGDVDKSAHGLTQLSCEERYGMIFVCLTPGVALDLDGYYGALLDEFADSELERCTYLGNSVVEGPNWKLILTNFLESYHFAAQHPKTVSELYVSDVNHYEAFGANVRAGVARQTIGGLHDVPRAQWGHQEGPAFTFIRHLFPNVIGSLGLFEAASSFAQILPGPTPDKSRVIILHVSKEPPKNEGARETTIKELQRVEDQVLRDEDFRTAFAAQKGLQSGAHKGLLYGRNERGPQYFHEWVDWYLRAEPNLAKPVL